MTAGISMKSHKNEFKAFSMRIYDTFESFGFTAETAVTTIENRIAKARSDLLKLTLLRNDMPRQLANPDETFDRKKHTHSFGNLQPGP